MILYFLGITLALLLYAFFAGSETGIISASRLKLRHWVEQGSTSAKVLHSLLAQPEYLLATTLVGTNIAVVTSSSLATSLFIRWLGPDQGAVLATAVIAIVTLLYGEILPKTVFRQQADRLVLHIALPLRWCERILWPVVFVITRVTRYVVRLFGPSEGNKNPFVTKEEIRMLVAEIGAEGELKSHEQGLIHGVLDFTHTPVSQVMVPVDRMLSVDRKWSREQIQQWSRVHGLTRFPVFHARTPLGFINVFDLFYHEEDWGNFIRPIRKVRPDEHIDVVIADMQAKKQNIALVMEHDCILGMITIQDLMEAIVSRMHGTEGSELQNG